MLSRKLITKKICRGARQNALMVMNMFSRLEMQELVLRRVVDAPHVAADAQDVHREERAVEGDEGEPEVELAEVSFIIRPNIFGNQK